MTRLVRLRGTSSELLFFVGEDMHAETASYRLFYGKKRQRLVALSPNDDARHQSSIHEKEDLFSQVHVNVAEEGFDLYDGLARYFDDVVEIGGQKKQMEVSIVDPPPLLQVQLQVSVPPLNGLSVLAKLMALGCSECNSTARRSRRINHKRTSGSERRSTWTVFSTARILGRRRARKPFRRSSPLHGNEYSVSRRARHVLP